MQIDSINGYLCSLTGKTFTMMGGRDCPGIIPMAIQNIFNAIENTPDREFLIRFVTISLEWSLVPSKLPLNMDIYI